jgi:hypothetical protein
MCLFQFSTCFEQPRAHHQENQLYQHNIWYVSLCVSDRLVCRSESSFRIVRQVGHLPRTKQHHSALTCAALMYVRRVKGHVYVCPVPPCGAAPRHGRQSACPSFSPGIELLYGLVTIFYSLSSFCRLYRFLHRLCVNERDLNVAAGLTVYCCVAGEWSQAEGVKSSMDWTYRKVSVCGQGENYILV